MSNLSLLALSGLFLAGCAATPNPTVPPGRLAPAAEVLGFELTDAAYPSAGFEANLAAPATFSADARDLATTAPAAVAMSTPYYSLDDDVGLREHRFTLKGGVWDEDDASAFGDGHVFNVAWTRYFTSLLALELELGYFDSDGSSGGLNGEVWAIPVMVNGRVNLPVWIIDLYAGLGVGGYYFDAEIGTVDDDGFLLGGNAFLGGTVNVADKIALGIEAKYYVSEDIDRLNSSLDAVAVMFTLGFAR